MALTSPETFTEQDKADLLGAVDEVASILGPSRPSPAKVTRARTLVKDIRVTCQTIPVSPITDDGTVTPPTPGPETPPIEPAPPETPPSGGGGGGSTSPPTTTTVVTTYTSQGDFSGSQGYRGWYYLSEDGTSMTYSAGSQLWSGTELYQGIWSSGQHPGSTNGAMRRWVAQGTGTFAITGAIYDADTSADGNAVTVRVKKNGTAIYTQVIADRDATGHDISLTGSCTAGDTFDFLVNGNGGIAYASTALAVSIALTTTTTSGSGSTTQTTLPFILNGTAPEEGTYTITANKPSNADGCTIAITGVNLAASYGRLYFNGSTNSLAIWATAPAYAGISATVTLTVPVAYMVNGSNTLRFTHDSGTGYTVTAIGAPAFTTPSTPAPPTTQTSLPFDLRGAILPEDGLLTLSLSKPSNANGASMLVTGVDLDGAEGALSVNGVGNSMSIWPNNAANNGVSRTVTLAPSVDWFQNGNNAIRFTHSSGDGFTVSGVSVTFTTPTPDVPPPQPSGTGAFQNLPVGMTTIMDTGFPNSLPAIISNVFNTQDYANFYNAPLSPPAVFKTYVPAGSPFNTGNGQWVVYLNNVREFFCGTWWSTNAEFAGWPNNTNKMLFLRNPNIDNNFLVWQGAQGAAKTIKWYNQAQYANNHLPNTFGMNWPTDATGWFEPNQGANATVAAGSGWHKIEFYQKASTTTTSRDGIITWWLDGQLVGHHTSVNLTPPGFTEFQINHTWDGGDRQSTTEWAHYWDHMLLAVR